MDIPNTVMENKPPIIPKTIGITFLFLKPKMAAIMPMPHDIIPNLKIFPAIQFAANDIDLSEDSVKNNDIAQITNEAHGYERLIIPKIIAEFLGLFIALFAW